MLQTHNTLNRMVGSNQNAAAKEWDIVNRMTDLIVDQIHKNGSCSVSTLQRAGFSDQDLAGHGSVAVEFAKMELGASNA